MMALSTFERWQMRVRWLFEAGDLITTPARAIPAPPVTAASDMIATTARLTQFTFMWSCVRIFALSIPRVFRSKWLSPNGPRGPARYPSGIPGPDEFRSSPAAAINWLKGFDSLRVGARMMLTLTLRQIRIRRSEF